MFQACFSPISGGYFVSQVAILSKLLEAKNRFQKPHMNVYFGASGGNLANIICSYFTTGSYQVKKIVLNLNPEMFIKNWWKGKSGFMSSKIMSFFKETLYQEGKGAVEFFNTFTPDGKFSSQETSEYWILTFNQDKLFGSLNCTKKRESSLFSSREDICLSGTTCGEIIYLNGQLEKIISTSLASATIPGVKEKVKIEDSHYVDGGVSNPTPGTLFTEVIFEKSLKNEIVGPFQYYYLFPKNFFQERKTKSGTWFGEIFQNFQSLKDSTIINDRRHILEGWLRLTNSNIRTLLVINEENVTLQEISDILESNKEKSYFITIYTSEDISVNFTEFNREDIENCYDAAWKTFSFHLLIKV